MEARLIPARCPGSKSLIGVGPERPTSWGNYFSMIHDDKEYSVANFWAENLSAAADKFLSDGMVRIVIDKPSTGLEWHPDESKRGTKGRLWIADDRIPQDWYIGEDSSWWKSRYWAGDHKFKSREELLAA